MFLYILVFLYCFHACHYSYTRVLLISYSTVFSFCFTHRNVVTYSDFEKAFDKVLHRRLISEIHLYEVGDNRPY